LISEAGKINPENGVHVNRYKKTAGLIIQGENTHRVKK
jgi:hypothetical protein